MKITKTLVFISVLIYLTRFEILGTTTINVDLVLISENEGSRFSIQTIG